jgi:hypothetical protein
MYSFSEYISRDTLRFALPRPILVRQWRQKGGLTRLLNRCTLNKQSRIGSRFMSPSDQQFVHISAVCLCAFVAHLERESILVSGSVDQTSHSEVSGKGSSAERRQSRPGMVSPIEPFALMEVKRQNVARTQIPFSDLGVVLHFYTQLQDR